MLARLVAVMLIPICAVMGQTSGIQPYAHAGTGFGFMKYEGGRTWTFEAGAVVKRYIALGIDRMQFAKGAESGTWTLANLRVYPAALRKRGGVWLGAGLGQATATGRESESAQFHTLYRFNGLGSKAAIGGDVQLASHLVVTPALAVRRSIGSAESSFCAHAYDTSGNFAPTTCEAWGPSSYPFQAVELSIALSFR
jgi:hypothetical protein